MQIHLLALQIDPLGHAGEQVVAKEQTPFAHSAFTVPHLLPQTPQLSGSNRVFTKAFPHCVVPYRPV
ncbi:MAG: hypothetical protein O2897_03325 [bacterium]|nr:hypothetical protein [bacterium]